jgi:hypothetical protein
MPVSKVVSVQESPSRNISPGYSWNNKVRSGREGLLEKPWSDSFPVKIQTRNTKVALAAHFRQ